MSEELTTTATPNPPATTGPMPPARFDTALDDWTLDVAVKACAGSDKAQAKTREMMRREVVALAREVAGPNPNAVEWSLATTIAVAWLAMRFREGSALCDQDGVSMRTVEYRWRLMGKATARYCSLLKTLAAVRRAGSPAVQVNIAGGTNQTNIGMP